MEGKTSLDSILNEIGYIGKAQIFYFVLICYITFFTGIFSMIYAFTAGDLNYRCFIDGCDNESDREVEFNPGWLKNAVPFNENGELPKKCEMYEFVMGEQNKSRDSCDVRNFNQEHTMKCNRFVFETEERTILTEFNLTCDENKWKLALSGTIHSAGVFFNLLAIGYLSDRFGRKPIFIASAVIASVFAIGQTFAFDYYSFLVLKFLEPMLGGGTYTTAKILSLELVGPEYRTIVGAIGFLTASVSKVFLGLGAMWLLNWKTLTLVSYIPNLISVAYIWILPESIRWLQIKGRYHVIANILLKIIRWNKIEVSEETRHILLNHPEQMQDHGTTSVSDKVPIREIFRSPPMLIRIITLAYCWLANLFIFYGLSLISVAIGGNKYTDFIIVNAMEIPACILLVFVSKRVGRKTILCGAFFVSGTALIVYTFVAEIYWMKLILFMIGKFAITMSFCTIFIYTSELVPTNLRQTLIGLCSSFGRIGSLTAPQAPLLEMVMKNLSIYLFAASALIGGFLALRFPETLSIKLPDTIDEALQIGRPVRKSSLT